MSDETASAQDEQDQDEHNDSKDSKSDDRQDDSILTTLAVMQLVEDPPWKKRIGFQLTALESAAS
ncbi:hypothetical protein [Paraburkholderia dipogonis]|uniref:hypothetical protein n=1 Tax=Paraburkholderia dipogonis TaxID=1211383 RepID=UPI0038BA8F7E